MKKIACLLLTFLLVLPLTSCKLDKYNKAYPTNKNGLEGYIYKDIFYYKSDVDFVFYKFNWDSPENIVVSWNWSFPHRIWIYSTSTENPLYIYIPQFDTLYIREDYQYKTDIFNIEETNISFVFEEAFICTDISFTNEYNKIEKIANISIQSTTHSEFMLNMDIVVYDGELYANASGGMVLKLSDYFIEILNKNILQ